MRPLARPVSTVRAHPNELSGGQVQRVAIAVRGKRPGGLSRRANRRPDSATREYPRSQRGKTIVLIDTTPRLWPTAGAYRGWPPADGSVAVFRAQRRASPQRACVRDSAACTGRMPRRRRRRAMRLMTAARKPCCAQLIAPQPVDAGHCYYISAVGLATALIDGIKYCWSALGSIVAHGHDPRAYCTVSNKI